MESDNFLQVVIDCYPAFFEVMQQHQCFEDYDRRHGRVKIDFWRRWYHTRTRHSTVASVDTFKIMGVELLAMHPIRTTNLKMKHGVIWMKNITIDGQSYTVLLIAHIGMNKS